MMQYVVAAVIAVWFAIILLSLSAPPSFHPCEVCGAPAGNYCTSCGSEQLAETD